MPTKTDRILSYLPSTFKAVPRPTALYAVADAFGGELQEAENTLAAVMQSHWVDHADLFAELFADLPQLAALYGLAPRDDEDIEEFRQHLKRYVRTFIEGTVTVQGILRIAADALGLIIADRNEDLDAWWDRPDETLTTTRARLDDAAPLVFGTAPVTAVGSDARAAAVTGTVDLSTGVDIRGAPTLAVGVDGGAPVTIDLSTVPNAASATANDIATVIDASPSTVVAGAPGGRVRLQSPTAGAGTSLTVADVDGDAAPIVLGLRARRSRGRAATAAELVGKADLSGGVELEPSRYIRIRVDATHEAEVDLRRAGPAHASLDDLRARINAELGVDVAFDEGNAIALRSPTVGASSSIELLAPAAEDATGVVFGGAPRFASGEDEQPARLVGHDVSAGLDLSDASRLAVSVDGADAVTVDCAGTDPAATRPGEVVEKLNQALGPLAGYDGHSITISSLTTGTDAAIAVEAPDEGDATEIILGIGSRSFAGADAVTARLTGPSEPVDLRAQNIVRIAIDGGPQRDVDVRAAAGAAGAVTPDEIAHAIDEAFGAAVAAVDGGKLVVASPTDGSAGRVAVEPLDETVVRRFVTRAIVRGEAVETLLGVLHADAEGEPERAAVIEGEADLSHGVDLRDSGWLRLSVDGSEGKNVPVAGPRPRAATLDAIVGAINGVAGNLVAEAVDGKLELRSPTKGGASSLVLTPPTAEDALDLVGLSAATVHGRDAVKVSFLGTVDLAPDVDLSGAARVRLSIDGNEQEIDCAGTDPAHTRTDEIVDAINTAFGTRFANVEGPRIRLQSQTAGAAGSVEFIAPTGGADATPVVFGITPPRTYHGSDAQPARIVGTKDLSGGLAFADGRGFLRITVDAGPAVSVDLGAGAANPASPSLDEAVAAVVAVVPGVASRDDGHLVLTSPTAGAGGRLTLEPYTSRDARPALLGGAPSEAHGSDGEPATITGTVDLLQPVDLSTRSTLVLAFDGGRPTQVDVAGATPATTFLDEVVSILNARFPGLAAATDDDHLRLQSTGERLEVLPARVLEVIEYPPQPQQEAPVRLRHGGTLTIDDNGAAEAEAEIELLAVRGIAAPGIANVSAAVEVRVLTAVDAGGRLLLRTGADGALEATVTSPSGSTTPVPPGSILIRPTGPDGGPDPLRIVRGRSVWQYLECLGTRYDVAHFDVDAFSGGPCTEIGVFDASSWGTVADAPIEAVFGDAAAPAEDSVEVSVRWTKHAPGRFAVNLPAELPPRFGARFGDGRFGTGADQVEEYLGAVTEPEGDPNDLAKLVHERPSLLVDGSHVATVPLGWSAVTLPFRRPQRLTVGAPGAHAALYLREEDVPGFIELQAREDGPQGASIVVTAPRSGPATFDVTVSFEAGRFENAREVVRGRPLSASADDLLRPGPIGVLEAKAAGVHAAIRREGTVFATSDDDN